MLWAKRIGLGLVGVAIAAAIVWGVMPKPTKVSTVNVVRADLEITLSEQGQTRVRNRYDIVAPVSGVMSRVDLDVGDSVNVGDVLFTVSPMPAQPLGPRELAQAKANIASAKSEIERADAALTQARVAKELADKRLTNIRDLVAKESKPFTVVSQSARDDALANAQSAEANFNSARFAKQVAEHQLVMANAALVTDGEAGKPVRVTSPVSASVLRVQRESSGTVQSTTPILTLGDPDDLEIVADFLTRDAVKIRKGMKARITRWGGEALEATVRHVERSGFTKVSALGVEEQRTNVVLDLVTKGVAKQMGDAYRVEVEVVVDSVKNALTAPESALFRDGDEYAVFRMKDAKAIKTTVQVGRRSGIQFEVLEGLEVGDRVIAHPDDALSDGASVTSD